MNKEVQAALQLIFEHVADAVDGNERVPSHLRNAYHQVMEEPAMLEFYGDLVDKRNQEIDGEIFATRRGEFLIPPVCKYGQTIRELCTCKSAPNQPCKKPKPTFVSY
mgnify:CR=1 FL=1